VKVMPSYLGDMNNYFLVDVQKKKTHWLFWNLIDIYIILDEQVNLMIFWLNFQKKKEERKKVERILWIFYFFHLSNQIIVLINFQVHPSIGLNSRLVSLYFVGYHFVINDVIILLCNIMRQQFIKNSFV